jgi:hypothetical protein
VDLAFIRDIRFGNWPLGERMLLVLPGTLASAHYGGGDEGSHSKRAEETRQPYP